MAIKDLTRVDRHVFLCNGSSCTDRGAADSTLALRDEIRACALDDRVHTTRTLCNGRCDDGPIVIVQPDGIWYKRIDPVAARQVVRRHVLAGEPVDSHVLYRWGQSTIAPAGPDTP